MISAKERYRKPVSVEAYLAIGKRQHLGEAV